MLHFYSEVWIRNQFLAKQTNNSIPRNIFFSGHPRFGFLSAFRVTLDSFSEFQRMPRRAQRSSQTQSLRHRVRHICGNKAEEQVCEPGVKSNSLVQVL